jgi:hypothetical protein
MAREDINLDGNTICEFVAFFAIRNSGACSRIIYYFAAMVRVRTNHIEISPWVSPNHIQTLSYIPIFE